MKKIQVIWTCTIDIICVPDIIANNIDQYTDDFREWVSGVSFDPLISHGTCFSIEQYIYFLNNRYLSEHREKVYLLHENFVPVTDKDFIYLRKMKKIYF